MPRVIISEPGKTPQPYRFKLDRKIVHIGRGSDNDIVLACRSCSTSHCVMERVDGGYILRDKGSTNGIRQDDTLMDIIDLYDGMEVMIGDVPMEFNLSDEEIAILSEEEFSTHQKQKLPPVKKKARDHHDDEVEKPIDEPKVSTASPRASHGHRRSSSNTNFGALKTLALIVLMIVAVVAGMILRHYKDTKEFLPAKLMQDQ